MMMVVRGLGFIPESVRLAVDRGHRSGVSHQQIFDAFEDEGEQRACAALLSITPEPGALLAFRSAQNWLIGLFSFFALMAAQGAFLFHAPVMLLLLLVQIAIIILAARRDPLGYSAAIGYVVLNVLVIIVDVVTRPAFIEGYLGVLIFLGVVALVGVLAFRLRRGLFPYMGQLGIRLDADGRPALLKYLLAGEGTQELLRAGKVKVDDLPGGSEGPSAHALITRRIKERVSNEKIVAELIEQGLGDDAAAAALEKVMQERKAVGRRRMAIGSVCLIVGAVLFGARAGAVEGGAAFWLVVAGIVQLSRGLILWAGD